jgi:hypothetical protein
MACVLAAGLGSFAACGETTGVPAGQLHGACSAFGTCRHGLACVNNVCQSAPDGGSIGSATNDGSIRNGTNDGSIGGPPRDASFGCREVDTSSDPANCGACGNVCALAESAVGAFVGPTFALDATSIYSPGDYLTVMRTPLRGGKQTMLAAFQESVWTIAVNATSVCWVAGKDVMGVPLNGGTPVTLAAGQANQFSRIAVDATSVLWTNYTTAVSGEVMKVPLAGGTVTTLAAGQAGPRDIAVDETSAYWTNDGGMVMKVSLAGGIPITLAAGQHPSRIAVDATSVYWTNTDGTVMKVSLAGGTPVTLAALPVGGGGTTGDSLAVGAAGVFWTHRTVGNGVAVMEVPLAGGVPVMLAPWTYGVPLVAYGSGVYWLTRQGVLAHLGACHGGVCSTDTYARTTDAGRSVDARSGRDGGLPVGGASPECPAAMAGPMARHDAGALQSGGSATASCSDFSAYWRSTWSPAESCAACLETTCAEEVAQNLAAGGTMESVQCLLACDASWIGRSCLSGRGPVGTIGDTLVSPGAILCTVPNGRASCFPRTTQTMELFQCGKRCPCCNVAPYNWN